MKNKLKRYVVFFEDEEIAYIFEMNDKRAVNYSLEKFTKFITDIYVEESFKKIY